MSSRRPITSLLLVLILLLSQRFELRILLLSVDAEDAGKHSNFITTTTALGKAERFAPVAQFGIGLGK